ncbi:MAG: hypothetical protein AB1832_18930 [Pseudomonadota bacterium]
MDLGLILDQVPTLNDRMSIYARPPWKAGSVADVALPGEDGQVLPELAERGLILFLTVGEAKQVLEVLRGRIVPRDTKRELLRHYAIHRAYPDWLVS